MMIKVGTEPSIWVFFCPQFVTGEMSVQHPSPPPSPAAKVNGEIAAGLPILGLFQSQTPVEDTACNLATTDWLTILQVHSRS
jgi:hypothetical protein